ncbi:hypothetical protein PSA7680_00946 [Pseudoruegeria aquimaris]|uniref:DUF3307 domain-containing protein n=1 Tax=Pseudoruegeria aquimaris TaxID=393663 RepID=A0A1Y5RQZ0_9RHOB|nr:DUF3307 domain-containing protein [Pseudoruegeria aquimaris]SLN23054.1 hypothetical protein PSA7680_00946 [Pseudoruegeria aquimaris]
MTATFLALLLGHLVADFLLQSGWMVRHKRRIDVLMMHAALVLICTLVATGQLAHPTVIAVALAHLLIDFVKVRLPRQGLRTFTLDQAAHLATLVIATRLAPDLWATGIWADTPEQVLSLMALACGAILSIVVGGYVVGLLCAPYLAAVPDDGLPGAGRIIGLLERGLIFILVLTGQLGSIALLIGAKSILRFSTVAADRKASEYVIIGTLASFGWALVLALATGGLLDLLPPLEIGALLP